MFDVVSETSLFTFKFLVWSVMWVNNWWTHLPRGPWELFSISEINIVRSMGLCWSAFPSHNLCHTYTGTQKNRKKGHKDLTSRFAAGKKTFIQKRALLRIDYKMTNFTDEDLDNYLQNQVTYLCCHVCRDLTRLMVIILFAVTLKYFILFCCAVNGGWMCYCQVDLRHRQVSKSVEDVQKIIKDLTAEVSSKDARFQSIANSGVHNASLKVILHVGFLCIKQWITAF